MHFEEPGLKIQHETPPPLSGDFSPAQHSYRPSNLRTETGRAVILHDRRITDLLQAQDPRLMEIARDLAVLISAAPKEPGFGDPRGFIVGGFVRDALLGIKAKDLDMEVYGVRPELLERLLQERFPGRIDSVGKSFGILKLHLARDLELDISIPRRESKTGAGHRGFAISSDPGLSLLEAARRRDFTWNALLADPLDFRVIDCFGGVADLERKVVRVTDTERFQDDPLRVYRAVQFCARFSMAIEEHSKVLMQAMVRQGALEELPRERLTDEMKKLLLKSARPSIGLDVMCELGIISRMFPEFDALRSAAGGPAWHRTLAAVDYSAGLLRDGRDLSTSDELKIMLGALCHAVPAGLLAGEERRGRRAETPLRTLLDKFSFSSDIERAVADCAVRHSRPLELYREVASGQITPEQYANALRILLRSLQPGSWRNFLAVSESISGAAPERGIFAAGKLFAEVVEQGDLESKAREKLLQGRDLIALGYRAGPQFSAMISQVELERDRGNIRNRDEAIRYLKENFEPSR